MKRRDFILRSTGAVTLPMLFNGLPLKAYDGPVLQDLFNTDVPSDRVLVLIQLSGGNDGLNTVVPLDQYATYESLRPNVAIPADMTLPLTEAAGFHPAMANIHEMWYEKKVGIVQGVGYPNPNLSHFRSTDIWLSGSDANVTLASGWIGRYLGKAYTGYPVGYPNETMPDPIAIQMGAVPGLSLINAEAQSMGIALQDPETFYSLVSGTQLSTDDLPKTPAARANVEYVREIQGKANVFSAVIKTAAEAAMNKATYPQNNKLGDQLKIVSRMIAGGLKTRVYIVQLGGFDTHASQVLSDDPTQGSHASLLVQLSEAVSAFQSDLDQLGVGDRVLSMTFSEFGRRATSNLSNGTDHGTAAPVFIFGVQAQDGITGDTPNLDDLDNNNLKMQFDFRQVYASVLEQWFGADPQVIREVLYKDFTSVKVVKTSGTSSAHEALEDGGKVMYPVYPNPVHSTANVKYSIQNTEHVNIQVFDALGFHVATVVNTEQSAGIYEIPVYMEAEPSGTYIVQGRIGTSKFTNLFVLVRN